MFDFPEYTITVIRVSGCWSQQFKLYLFYNNYETSYTPYFKHARWYRCLRSDGPHVGGNRSAWRKLTCLTW